MPDFIQIKTAGGIPGHGMQEYAQRYADYYDLGPVIAFNIALATADFEDLATVPPCFGAPQLTRASDGKRWGMAFGQIVFTPPWPPDGPFAWTAIAGGDSGIQFFWAGTGAHFPDGTLVRDIVGDPAQGWQGVVCVVVDCSAVTSLGSAFDLIHSVWFRDRCGPPPGPTTAYELKWHIGPVSISGDCGKGTDDGGGGGTSPIGKLSLGAIEADGPRQYIHVGAGKEILTFDAEYNRLWSGSYPVTGWKKLRCDPRRGTLAGMAIAGKKDSAGVMQPWHSVWVSGDGGQTANKVKELASTSSVLERDSERGWLLWWTSAQDPDDDKLTNAVSLSVSEDGGETWNDPVKVKLDDGKRLNELLLDTCQDCRTGGRLGLLVGSGFLLVSDDGGETFRRVA